MQKLKITFNESDIHPHLRDRMQQRGISLEDVETTINEDWDAEDTKEGTSGKVFVFSFNEYWEGKYFRRKKFLYISSRKVRNLFC